MFGINTKSILRLGDLLAGHRGWTRSTVSNYAANHGLFLQRLAEGRDITTRKAARVVQWLSDHWPEDLEWPDDIPRPAPRRKDAA